ncbi:heterokaryon incompatibility protein-domain-containing protein [Annulohypoxylon nitens]|nr:heterokaryon incompatibility protein-domain-containing protein [Annulohypoxylon nitens]
MTGICNCRRPVIQKIVENLWMCTECGTEIPDDEELEEPQGQNHNTQRAARISSLNLTWPKSVDYIEDDLLATTVIKGLEQAMPTLYSDHRKPASSQLQEEYQIDFDKTGAAGGKYYSYEPLSPKQFKDPSHNQFIRILRLSRGNPRDPLHGKLISTSLSDNPDFEAVSYTWADETGNSVRRRPLYIGNSWQRLPITNNCEAALRRFRRPDQDIDLWVDSICINQQDLKERRQQVSLMPTIYPAANNVLVYLGAGSQDTSNAMFVLGLQGESAEKYLHDYRYNESLRVLFHLPYFSRIWIIQELSLAKQVRLYHGYDQQSVCLRHARDRVLRIFNAAAPGDVVPLWLQHYEKKLSTSEEVGKLIFDGMSSNSSLPQDKVFAFFGMIWRADAEGLVADYDLAVEQVYTGIAAYLVSKGHLLEVLDRHRRNLTGGSRVGHFYLDIPSWVPDFRGLTATSRNPIGTNTPDLTFRPLCVRRSLTGVDIQSNCIGILQKTGSLVIHGHLIHAHWWPSRTEYPLSGEDFETGIKFDIEFEELFDPENDTIVLFDSEKNGLLSLHLRKSRILEHGSSNIYTFVGLCKINYRVILDESETNSPCRPFHKFYEDHMIGLLSLNRPLFDEFVSIGHYAFNDLWTIYRFLEETASMRNILCPWPSPSLEVGKNPWENFLDLFSSATPNYDQDLPSIQARFLAFAKFYDFWASVRNYEQVFDVIAINTIPERIRGTEIWNEWLQSYGIASSATENLTEATLTLTIVDRRMLTDLQRKIKGWESSTLDLIGGLNWPQNLKRPLMEILDENTGRHYVLDLLTTENIQEIFRNISSYIEIRIQAILQEHLSKEPSKSSVEQRADYIKGYMPYLIGDWVHFIESFSLASERDQVTDEVKIAFEKLQYPSLRSRIRHLHEKHPPLSLSVDSERKEVVII